MGIQTLDIVSANLWEILISLANLLILFLLFKKFLFKPVQNVLNQRQSQVDKIYDDAAQDKAAAASMKQEYEARLDAAREEADTLVRNAVQTAQRKSDQIVSDANSQASHLKQKAEEEIALEKKQMLLDVKSEISEMAVNIASKVVEREIQKKDHENFVDEFIKNVGEQS